jgi:hypothetical protein
VIEVMLAVRLPLDCTLDRSDPDVLILLSNIVSVFSCLNSRDTTQQATEQKIWEDHEK